jgi:hypothetical protein
MSFIIREIFHLHFGHYRQVKALLNEARQKKLLLDPPGARILTDFTSKSCRVIIELPFATLSDYENALKHELDGNDWPDWYSRFKQHVCKGEREILRLVTQGHE